MNTKLFTAGLAGAGILFAVAFVSCQKEELIFADNNETITGQKGGNPTVQTLNPPVGGKAYSAVFNSAGTCTGGPIVTYNSSIRYFNPTNGTGEIIVNNQVCYARAVAENPLGCDIYVAVGTSASGVSQLFTISNTGALTLIGDLRNPNGTPFYVDEMECDISGNLIFLNGVNVFSVPQANITGPNITVQSNGTIGSITVNRKYSLCRNGIQMRVVLDNKPFSGPTTTTIYNLTVPMSGSATIAGVATYNSPVNSIVDIATYYHAGVLYYAKSGNLYNLVAGTNVGIATMSTFNDMTYRGICNQ
ncbi:MAG: hypothetical protein IM638_01340 [Bacteroidetes bacterium]|nr:hypothetical protein [Bacteroidota bacterium]